MSSSNGTSPSLLAGLQISNSDAWQKLVSLYGPRILVWCRLRGVDQASAADILQETLLSVARSLPQFHSNPGSGAFRAWLKRIAERRISDWLRVHSEQPNGIGGSSIAYRLMQLPGPFDESKSEIANYTDASRSILEILEAIKPSYEPKTWQAFERCVIDGKETAEVATEIGLTPANVRQIRSRILRHIRQALNIGAGRSGSC
ncbi:MAG: sigma-70 family RNA polymerase sigma factor [Pirellula sp.]